ncbi:hypothetical protein [Anaerotignum sp. MB30-C6]|uniref:hypothetical protein n=1 Tax=Anaerotignum sp. MB30-C6 TaxID=3070814 RepID=UPI0027DDBF98|nr:hypothetical protein [Anaerotignum sp. MB30-C6]WMI81858.1 hypothetical protein RBQ60_03775 [Anaerotignum sp. MB30-C6]WMI81958.1 hypothetical protein RBQ60_04290 [Anaerotignum sp. MB30-C6]
MSLTNIGLVAFVKTKLGTPYVYGMKGTVMTQANFNYLQERYGVRNVWNSDEKKVGKVCVDCSGLISWYTGKLKGSSQFKAESDAQPITTIASAPIGAAVWRQGHIGVYIGNGEVIEARGSAYGTVRTKAKDRDFTHWFLLRDIEYIEGDEEMITREKIIVNGKECEVDMIRKDGTTYIKTRDIAEVLGLKVGSKGKVPVIDTK